MDQLNEGECLSWKRPDEVMRQHRLKLKQRALQARLTRSEQGQLSKSNESTLVDSILLGIRSSTTEKRKNPFKQDGGKRFKSSDDLNVTSDSSLFKILSERQENRKNEVTSETSFQSFLVESEQKEVPLQFEATSIPVDWSLKTKIRLISPNPFPWSQKLRTCEEASGITGYVRCLDTGMSDKNDSDLGSGQSLDTSPNARFHQCGLYWQHPSLPWLPLFPRVRGESAAASSGLPPLALDPMIKDALHQEWCESFRSLFQLVRARQCPFFYLCANAFTCLFRAAGVAGVPEMHALLTPTTRGLRAALKEEDVVFSMPLKKSPERKSSQGRTSDEGYHTLEEAGIGGSKRNSSSPVAPSKDLKVGCRIADNAIESEIMGDEEEEEEEEASEWLERMGVTEAEIKRMESEQAKHVIDSERDIDRKPESLVYVEGVEAQALFNFLMDCRSCVAPTGPLAGVPPTLLSPVAFRGATLGALKVRHSVVKVEGQSYQSVELRGPILPTALHSLSSLICSSPSSTTKFTATFAGVSSTRPFSHATGKPPSDDTKDTESAVTASVFEKESLSDCGLFHNILETFCKSSNSVVLDNLKFSDSVYSWSLS
ncbi:protein downstream neighbor of son homolog [Ischnura elegans]|uniref:protein downstream neighbor of son homolog n=1 Tax=Ischnura elegans TaxID=197161 RepID=UPI001ED87CB6|nr:protein downstream neighbor of son homolog [Ischnura elegans]